MLKQDIYVTWIRCNIFVLPSWKVGLNTCIYVYYMQKEEKNSTYFV
mgnify:CR=1 FL=1